MAITEDMHSALPEFTCRVCLKSGEAYQISVYGHIEFLSCQNCNSVTTLPIPTPEEITLALGQSRLAQSSAFPNNIEKKHYLKHISDLKTAAKGDCFIDVTAHNGVRTEMTRIKAFPDATGIDGNAYAIDIAQKRFHKPHFFAQTLGQFAKTSEDRFDAAACYHGLESTDDPDSYLTDLRKILNPNAVLYLSLCDGNHLMTPHSFMRWREVRYPERVHYFSRDGLNVILRRNGFKVIKRYSRFWPYQHVIARLKDVK